MKPIYFLSVYQIIKSLTTLPWQKFCACRWTSKSYWIHSIFLYWIFKIEEQLEQFCSLKYEVKSRLFRSNKWVSSSEEHYDPKVNFLSHNLTIKAIQADSHVLESQYIECRVNLISFKYVSKFLKTFFCNGGFYGLKSRSY